MCGLTLKKLEFFLLKQGSLSNTHAEHKPGENVVEAASIEQQRGNIKGLVFTRIRIESKYRIYAFHQWWWNYQSQTSVKATRIQNRIYYEHLRTNMMSICLTFPFNYNFAEYPLYGFPWGMLSGTAPLVATRQQCTWQCHGYLKGILNQQHSTFVYWIYSLVNWHSSRKWS